MADGQVQLPPDGTGKALRTVEQSPPAGVTGGSDGYVHQQAATLADQSGYLHGDPRQAELRTDQTILALILRELRLLRLTLADMAGASALDVTDDMEI